MDIALMALLGIALAYLLVRFGPRAQKKGRSAEETVQRNRIGDGLRRLNENKKKYAVLTSEQLGAVSDDGLIEAVLSNLWAKMKPDMEDALDVIGQQTLQRQFIFALYAVTGGVKQVGFEKLKQSPDAELLPTALSALETLEMMQSAGVLRSAMETPEADQYQEAYGEAFEGENGKERMAAYIRENAAGFTDM